eukprot:m51a1_g4827 hypothetical protein (1415) ;mRNA; r:175542-181940
MPAMRCSRVLVPALCALCASVVRALLCSRALLEELPEAEYTGDFDARGRCTGVGVLRIPGVASYEGQFLRGLLDGWGRLDQGGLVHEGRFRSGEPDGWGVETVRSPRWPSTSVGFWRRGQRHGPVLSEYAGSGLVVFADYADGVVDGSSVMFMPDGSRLEERYERGVLVGRVRLRRADGSLWLWQARNGRVDDVVRALLCSRALLEELPEAEYTGDFDARGRCTGVGVLRIPGVASYEGQFLRGLLDGWGRLDQGGLVHEGRFRSGEPDGWGVETVRSPRWPSTSVGFWRRGQRHGPVLSEYAGSGLVVFADYADGVVDGSSVMFMPDGSRLEERYERGVLVGRVRLRRADGSLWLWQARNGRVDEADDVKRALAAVVAGGDVSGIWRRGADGAPSPLEAAALAGDSDAVSALLDAVPRGGDAGADDAAACAWAALPQRPELRGVAEVLQARVVYPPSWHLFTYEAPTADAGAKCAASLLLAGDHAAALSLLRSDPVQARVSCVRGPERLSVVMAAALVRPSLLPRLAVLMASVNHCCRDGSTALTWACARGDLGAVRLLLLAGAAVDYAPRSSAGSPLYLAAQSGSLEIAQALIDAGAAVDAESGRDMRTPLFAASQRGHLAVVELLLRCCADASAREPKMGCTPLMMAARYGHLGVARALLDAGADPRALTASAAPGCAPLSALAMSRAHADVALLLFARGALIPDGAAELARGERSPYAALLPCAAPAEDGASLRFDPAAYALRAVGAGDVCALREALGRHPEVVGASGCAGARSLLAEAAAGGRDEAVEALLRAGHRVDGPAAPYGSTALFLACCAGCTRAAELLLDAGARVDAGRVADGATPLWIACHNGREDAARLLVARGADVRAAESAEGRAPLLVAAQRGFPAIAELLLASGAPPDAADSAGETALVAACRGGDAALAESLLRAGATFASSPSALLVACESGHPDVAALLLGHGAPADPAGPAGCATPLSAALQLGDAALVRALLDAGADADRAAPQGPPLLLACSLGRADLAELLLARGASVCPANRAGALLSACARGDAAVARVLLRRGCPADRCDAAGQTPLALACARADEELIDALVDAGAAVDRPLPATGETLLLRYAALGAAGVVRALLRAGAAVDRAAGAAGQTPLYASCLRGHCAVAADLVAAGANVNKPCSAADASRPLHAACAVGCGPAVLLLARAGAQLDAPREPDKRAPLHVASARGDAEAVRALVEAGARVDLQDAEGRTPLMLACAQGHSDAAQLLVGAGARVDAATPQGQTPAVLAGLAGHARLCRFLCSQGGAPLPERWREAVAERLGAAAVAKLLAAASRGGKRGAAAAAAEEAEGAMPREFLCPITMEAMREPVVASDGFAYEGAAIRKWFRASNISPMTGLAIETTLVPCNTLRSLIASHAEQRRK